MNDSTTNGDTHVGAPSSTYYNMPTHNKGETTASFNNSLFWEVDSFGRVFWHERMDFVAPPATHVRRPSSFSVETLKSRPDMTAMTWPDGVVSVNEAL